MILDYIKFKKFPLTTEIPLFFIHGNPRNISNEIERDILNFHKKFDYKIKNYVIDDDTQTEGIKSNLQEQSLFEEKKLIVLNIVSKSIPINIKKLIDEWITLHNIQDRIIIKLDRQASSFKTTNFYKSISTNACVIEIYELKGQVLEQWVANKLKINNINYDANSIRELINLNFNNSLAISQAIYLRGLTNDKMISTHKDSKYTEYDLIDTILNRDIVGFIKVSNYLRNIDSPLTYIIFLINIELEKIYSIVKPTLSQPYIPSFLKNKYTNASNKYNLDELLHALKNVAGLDIKSKYMSKKTSPWTSFNSLLVNLMKS
tara:strand:- start:10109 stop:11062 length:954 start_codon:yes stop_codon:yes gene_type:complete